MAEVAFQAQATPEIPRLLDRNTLADTTFHELSTSRTLMTTSQPHSAVPALCTHPSPPSGILKTQWQVKVAKNRWKERPEIGINEVDTAEVNQLNSAFCCF